MSELSEILEDLWDAACEVMEDGGGSPESDLELAKKRLKALFKEVVGEDDKYNDFCPECNNWDEGRNDLREMLVKRIEEL